MITIEEKESCSCVCEERKKKKRSRYLHETHLERGRLFSLVVSSSYLGEEEADGAIDSRLADWTGEYFLAACVATEYMTTAETLMSEGVSKREVSFNTL